MRAPLLSPALSAPFACRGPFLQACPPPTGGMCGVLPVLRLFAGLTFTYINLNTTPLRWGRPELGREFTKLGHSSIGPAAGLALSTSRALGMPSLLERPRYVPFMVCFHAFTRLSDARHTPAQLSFRSDSPPSNRALNAQAIRRRAAGRATSFAATTCPSRASCALSRERA